MTEQQWSYLKQLNRQFATNAIENPILKGFWNRKIVDNAKKFVKKDMTRTEFLANLENSGISQENVWFSEEIGQIMPEKIDLIAIDDTNYIVKKKE